MLNFDSAIWIGVVICMKLKKSRWLLILYHHKPQISPKELTSGTLGTMNDGGPFKRAPYPGSESQAGSEKSLSSPANCLALRSWPVMLVVEYRSMKVFMMKG